MRYRSDLDGAVLWSVAQCVLTTVHHVYGAFVFDTPQRLHMLAIALPIAAASLIASSIYERNLWGYGRPARRVVLALGYVFPLAIIGVIEGGYNHVLKNGMFFAGLSSEAFALFFPAQFLYQAPRDAFFELTGVAQAVLASVLFWKLRAARGRTKPA